MRPETAPADEPALTDHGPSPLGDLPPEEFRRLARETVDWVADFLEHADDFPVFPDVRPGYLRHALPDRAPEDGESMGAVLEDFRSLIVPGITHWNHPAFFGYFSISASGPGILGELLAAALNVNAMVWRSSPAATELEDVTTEWLRALLGLPDGFEGVINDTASSSTLYALAAAREAAYPDAHRAGLFGARAGRVYASEQAHSSVEKAVLTLGFGQEGYRTIPADADFRMDVAALRSAIEEDVADGIVPVAVVPTLGTTSSASLDPIAEIAPIAREHGAWLHVDAAYGGPAAILPELRPLFAGWESADSIVVNPHKWLFTPIDCSVLYCRRPETLVRAFSIVPEYLTSREQAETRSLMDYGVSLGRRFRSLKLWFVLRYFGRAGLERRIRRHVEMARNLARRIEATEGWRVVAPVHLGLVAFRLAPPDMDGARVDALNRRILDRVDASGEAFLTHTVLDGRVALRLSIGNVRTTQKHVDRAWELLEEAGRAELANQPEAGSP
jgi:aromatic-L-amino-acid decarboxylase